MWLSLRRGTWVSLTLELAAKMVWRWQLLLPEWKFRGYFITLTPQKHTRGRETLESHQLCLYTSYLLHILLLQTFTACACWLGPCAKAKAISQHNEYLGLCSTTGRFSLLPIFLQFWSLLFLIIFLATFAWMLRIWQSGQCMAHVHHVYTWTHKI